MFKQAFVRGVQNALIQGGHVVFSDDDSATKVADYIASRMDFDPVNNAVPREVTFKVATAIVEASAYLQKQAGFKAASYTKVASVDDLSKLAHAHALDVMQKAAEGSNYEGGDKGNTENSSAEGKMDAAARPPGYAENSLGKTEVDTKPGAVGKEQEQPAKPAETPAGSNSVIDQSKTSALGVLISKLAQGSNFTGGDKGNTENTSAEAKMDASLRPPGYAVLPSQGALGELMNQAKGPAIIGRETPHPVQPGESPSGTNSLTQHSAKAASESHYVSLFKETAAEVSPYLPGAMHEDTKIAHVRACMGMTTPEKAQYLQGLQKEAADNTAALPPGSRGDHYQQHTPEATHSRPGAYDGRKGNQGTKQAELPPFIQEKIDAKKDGGGDDKKDDDKKDGGGAFPGAAPPFGKKDDGDKKDDKDEKKDDEKKDEKEASLRDYFRRINNTVQPRT